MKKFDYIFNYYDAYKADQIRNKGRKTLADLWKNFKRKKKLEQILKNDKE